MSSTGEFFSDITLRTGRHAEEDGPRLQPVIYLPGQVRLSNFTVQHCCVFISCCGLCKDDLHDFRLKSIDVVIRNTNEAKDMLKNYETRLREVNKVPDEEKELEDHRRMLKVFPLFWGKMIYVRDCLQFAVPK